MTAETDKRDDAGTKAEALFRQALALHREKALERAAALYREAIALKADYTSARINLGNALLGLGRPREAEAEYRGALAMGGESYLVHRGLSIALSRQGRVEEALTSLMDAAAAAPENPVAHAELTNALFAADRFAEAERSYRAALGVKPDYNEALHNLGASLLRQYRWSEALSQLMTAWRQNPTPQCTENVLKCLLQIASPPDSAELRGIMADELLATRYRLDQLQLPAARLLKAGEPLKSMLAKVAAAWPERLGREALAGEVGFRPLWEDQLLLPLLEATTICSLEFERLFVTIRRILLAEAVGESVAGAADLPLLTALARQSYINEYLYETTPEEERSLAAVAAAVEESLSAGEPPSPVKVAAIAAYAPLCDFPFAEALLGREWPECVSALLAQQVTEPLVERGLREKIPLISGIGDAVSLKVREQYEENPYPRWVRLPAKGRTYDINTFLREFLPDSRFSPQTVEGSLEVLIAGCGTGRHPIGAANRFSNSKVLAVDLSLSSLCYARRKAEEIGVENLSFAHADILSLGGIGRKFDVIESVGVLHHMAEPLEGWRVLVSLLKPGGFMAVGLYSELARQGVVRAREFIAEKGYLSNREDMRKCRRELIAMRGDPAIAKLIGMRDFFGTSECRDLIFHVQEHRFTFPMIKAALAELGLEFVGIYQPLGVRRAYRERFPDDPTMTDLDNWHLYEIDHPDTFIGMYQFWTRKRD